MDDLNKTCGTCRHWNRDRVHPNMGLCMRFFWENGIDFERPVTPHGVPPVISVPMVTDLASCSHWELK